MPEPLRPLLVACSGTFHLDHAGGEAVLFARGRDLAFARHPVLFTAASPKRSVPGVSTN